VTNQKRALEEIDYKRLYAKIDLPKLQERGKKHE